MVTLYSENPNLDFKTVQTVDGSTEYRVNCRRIKDEYYIKNKDVFFVDRTWYILSKGNILFDHERNEMVIKKTFNGLRGIVGKNSDGSFIYGYFSRNIYNNVDVLESNPSRISPCINLELVDNTHYFCTKTGAYVLSKSQPIIKNMVDHRRGTYNIDDNASVFNHTKDLYEKYNHPITADLKKFAKFLGDMTYGIEIECIEGNLPEVVKTRHGVVVCRDGSLRAPDGSNGPEYVTVPMKGAKGLSSIIGLSKQISKYNRINYNCALHVHVGNLRVDRAYLVAMYKLGVYIQRDLFKMFPFYKTNEVKYAGKEKNYCKMLKNIIPDYTGSGKEDYDKYIDDGYKILFTFLLDGKAVPTINLNRVNRVHPQGNKWERVARYYWLNFMNLFFSNRNTFEFRLHTPTTNSKKIISWLFMIKAITKYAEHHSDKIIKGHKPSIEEILNEFSNNTQASKVLINHLLSYYKSRCDAFEKLRIAGDYVPESELTQDSSYTFDFQTDLKQIF
jgi:hypothetical protein